MTTKRVTQQTTQRLRSRAYRHFAAGEGASATYHLLHQNQADKIVSLRTVQTWLAEYRKQSSPEALARAESDLDPAAREQMSQVTPEGFKAFFDHYAGYPGGLAPFHYEWVKEALGHDNVLVNCPPRHAKSEIFSVWFPIWLVSILPNIQILIISQTDKLAKKFCLKIAAHLGRNERLIRDFGPFKPELEKGRDTPWRPNSGELLVARRDRLMESGDLTIQVRGAQQQILGLESDWIICDDIVSRDDCRTEGQREKLSEYFHGDVLTRREPGCHTFVIGQRLHPYDLYQEISEDETWHHINQPAVLDWVEKEVLWPDARPWDYIMAQRKQVGEDLFEAMYQQNPSPGDLALAKREWFLGDDEHPGCIDLNRSAGDLLAEIAPPGSLQDSPLSVVRVVSLDPSPTRYAGMIVADVASYKTRRDIVILEAVRQKMTVKEMRFQLDRVIETYHPHYLIFEVNAAQRWLLQDEYADTLRRKLRVLPHTTNVNKQDPEYGIQTLALDFEFGLIRFPYADAESRAQSDAVFEEALAYPLGKTDDLLMALWFIKHNYRRLVPQIANDTPQAGWFNAPRRLLKGFPQRGVRRTG